MNKKPGFIKMRGALESEHGKDRYILGFFVPLFVSQRVWDDINVIKEFIFSTFTVLNENREDMKHIWRTLLLSGEN